MHRRINSPAANSKIIMGPSDTHTSYFKPEGGLIFGKSANLADNIKLYRSGLRNLDLVSGDDTTVEGSFSNKRIAINLKNITFGSSSNPINNIKIHRNGDQKIQFVLGNDTTPEGTTSTNLATFLGLVPVGTVVFWIGGYFLNSSNGSYTKVLGSTNTVAGVNGYANAYGWYVCDGTSLNDSRSPIFNSSGRYLPNLSDERFLSGSTFVGSIGGGNNSLHTHTITPLTSVSGQPSFTAPGHYHSSGSLYTGTDSANHDHGNTGISIGSSSAGSHYHFYNSNDWGVSGDWSGGGANNKPNCIGYPTGVAGSHTHGVSSGWSHGSENYSHSHSIGGYVGNGGGSYGNNAISLSRTSDAVVTSVASISSVSSGAENRPLYLAGFYLIRAF